MLLKAQATDLKQTWMMNEKLLDLIENYERYSSFEGRLDEASFLELFVSPGTKVWCDYLSSDSFGRYVDARTYAGMSRDFAYNSVKVSNLRKSAYVFVDGAWHTRLEFNKQVSYQDGMGYTFSTQSKLAGGDFRFALDCVWVPDESVFRIEKVLGSGSKARNFPDGQFRIVKRQEGIDSKLLYNGMPLDYNEYGFAVLPGQGEFSINDDDFRLNMESAPGRGRYEVCSLSASPKLFRVRPRADFLINPLYIETIYGAVGKPVSFGVEAGVDFGVALNFGGGLKYIPSVGIGISHSWFGLSNYFFTGEKVMSYDYFDRPYEFRASGSFTFEDFTVSLALASFEYGFGNGLTAAVEAGPKFYLNLSASDNFRLTEVTSPENFNLRPGFKSSLNTPLELSNKMSYALFTKGGIDYSVMDSGLVFLRLGVEYGFNHKLFHVGYGSGNEALSEKKWYDPATGLFPLRYEFNGDGNPEDIIDHTFKDSIHSVHRRLAGLVEFGFTYKF